MACRTPTNKLRALLSSDRGVAYLACGAFSPITSLHIKMLEWAKNQGEKAGYTTVGGYVSPVNDGYKKESLKVGCAHRLKMCELATEDNDWVELDPWEAAQPGYQRTISVLDHVQSVVSQHYKDSGVTPKSLEVALVCGSDMFITMADPKIWAPKDIDQILSNYLLFVVEREGQGSAAEAMETSELLGKYKEKVFCFSPEEENNTSSTLVRKLLAESQDAGEYLSEKVIDYIKANNLYSKQ